MLRKPVLLRSSKLAQRRRRLLYIKAALVVISAALVVGVGSYLLHRPEVVIETVSIYGNEVISEQDLHAVVGEALAGNYAFLFPKSNIFIYPKRDIQEKILQTFPRVGGVSLEREGFRSISVNVEERHPFALWCREATLSPSIDTDVGTTTDMEETHGAEVCYFLDDGGYIFSEAPQFTGTGYFRYYGDLSVGAPIHTNFLGGNEFGRLAFFIENVEQLGVRTVSLSMKKDGEVELVHENGGKFLFVRDQNLSEVLDNLESALRSEIFRENDLSTLEYIDLRFGNKVYYKFR